MNIRPEILVLIGALVSFASAFIGAVSALGVTYLSKRSEEKKHFRELIVNTALKNWEKDRDAISKTLQGGYVEPLTDYILHTSKAVELILDEKTTPENLESKLKDLGQIVKITRQYRMKQISELKDLHYDNT